MQGQPHQNPEVTDPKILVLANGASPSERANERGHLFEQFVARLLHRLGYESPTTENLNITTDGIEIDVSMAHRLTSQPAIAECKAYSRHVPVHHVEAFYGKLTVSRMSTPSLHGLFIAIPRLTAQGIEQVETIREADTNFTYVNTVRLWEELTAIGDVSPPSGDVTKLTDFAAAITPYGVFSLAKELDDATRLSHSVRVWTSDGRGVPEPAHELIAASEYASGLPIIDADGHPPPRDSTPPRPSEDLIVEVSGSSSDFEYQLPASPKYFVGRRQVIRDLCALVTQSRPGSFVLNAQSGWGKSSLALRLQQSVAEAEGACSVFDARTATHASYVPAALRRAAIGAENIGLLALPGQSDWGSLAGAIRTIAASTWIRPGAPLVIFFDQFENTFREVALTRQFRDLALAVRELPHPVLIGYAWKTDLVGWTEDHPYQLRDEIRSNSAVFTITPWGASEVETLIKRLDRHVGSRLTPELRRRLREYSQGLPWLLKKLGGHIIRELGQGVSQDRLVAEALNVQRLFESDLAELQPEEADALRYIARYAPVAASDVMDQAPAPVVQSLLDRRLIVQVGEKLDTYWDVFRDFLVTGRVPIEDSYILRQVPHSVARLMREVVELGGDARVGDLTTRLGTSPNVVFNLARDLRLFGVLAYEPNRIKLLEEVWTAVAPDIEVRARIADALRRHRAYTLLLETAELHGGKLDIATFAGALPRAFPAVDVRERTWRIYARSFILWLEYAGLVEIRGQDVVPAGGPQDVQPPLNLFSASPRLVGARGAFPQSGPGPAVELLARVRQEGPIEAPASKRDRKALRELVVLGAVVADRNGRIVLHDPELVSEEGEIDGERLLELIRRRPGAEEALALLDNQPGVRNSEVGRVIDEATSSSWQDSTRASVGGWFRSWVRAAGRPVSRPSRKL